MHILKTLFRYTTYVFVNYEMGTLHHWRCRNTSNKKILKTLNELNSSSLYRKHILHIIDALTSFVSQDIFYAGFNRINEKSYF